MSKRKMCPASQLGARKKVSTGSSVERPVIPEPLTSKDTSRFESGVLSFMFGISSQTGAILRAQEVLLDKIELIALKVETLSKEVQLMKAELPVTAKRSQETSWLPSNEEIKAWLNSPIPSPTHGSTMDLTCSETPYPSLPPLNVQQFTSGGSMELPEWASLV